MKRIALPLTALAATATLATATLGSTLAPEPGRGPVPVHCQVPCGIYGDQTRIDLLMEDAATIEKGMNTLNAMEKMDAPSRNQMVRWVMTKDEHAQKVQDQVGAYWLAQRIKAPKDPDDAAAREHYHRQLELLHGINVTAMKCKQSIDVGQVKRLRELVLEFSATYFTAEDLEHIRSHHGK